VYRQHDSTGGVVSQGKRGSVFPEVSAKRTSISRVLLEEEEEEEEDKDDEEGEAKERG
jgi:hypothetical protein